jgi:Na+/H+-translocating membrane pyrophosphatase
MIYFYIRRHPAGNEGAMAFLRREYSVLAVFVLVVGGLLWLAIGMWTRRWPSSSARSPR